MSRQEIQTLLVELCREIESLWKISGYKSYGSNTNEKTYVLTHIHQEAIVLPISKFPVRGVSGVEVKIHKSTEDQRNLIFSRFTNALFGDLEWRMVYQNNKDYGETKIRIHNCEERLFRKFFATPNLLERLSESSGSKYYEPSELTEKIKDEISCKSEDSPDNIYETGRFRGRSHFISVFLVLAEILANEFYEQGFEPQKQLSFEEWNEIALRVTEKLYSIAEKTYNEYEIVVFLNSPSIDEKASFQLNDKLSIEYATDDLLSKLHKYNKDVRLGCINTAVKYKIAIEVNASVEQYLCTYITGAKLADTIVDCLRLIRDEDIGVIALEIFPIDDFTPHIRKTYEEYYQSELAIFVPRRFYFQTEYKKPLSEQEIYIFCNLLSSYSEIQKVKGLNVAIQRFCSSCERYLPNEPERLLDVAIALEAIFLNDDDTKELTYRLSLRAARLLGKTLEERREIFSVIKQLYKFRSKIAHGEVLEQSSDKLKQVLIRSPRILKDAIIEMILGNAPRGLQNSTKIGEWWRDLELGMGDIPQVSNSEQENDKS